MISMRRLAGLLPLLLACRSDPTPSDSSADTGTGETDTDIDGESASTDTTESTDTDTTESTDTTTDTTDTETTETDTTETTGDGNCTGECGSPGCGDCPNSPTEGIDDYTIGATEVTNAEYAQFLAVEFEAGFVAGWLPPECDWKFDFTPDQWQDDLTPNLPVVGVDWCDAWAYCEWSDQHLCGAVGGGPIDLDDINDPALAQWHRACTGGGGTPLYPYGAMYDPGACNGADAGFEQLLEVGSLRNCNGGYPGIFDMSGNVWEWENSCDVIPLIEPEEHLCQMRGGSYFSDAMNLLCSADLSRVRSHRDDNVGIRCCGVL
jgi:sulfatase modifying factor 1